MQHVGEMELCEMIIGEIISKALTEDIIQSVIEIKKRFLFTAGVESEDFLVPKYVGLLEKKLYLYTLKIFITFRAFFLERILHCFGEHIRQNVDIGVPFELVEHKIGTCDDVPKRA